MLYLIYGQDRFVLEKTVTKEVKKLLDVPDALNYVKFDARQNNFVDIMTEVDYLPLGINKKVVLVDYTNFFDKKGILNKSEENEFIKFVEAQNDDITLFLIVREALNKKHSLVKAIEQHGKIIEIKDISANEWPKLIDSIFAKNNKTIDFGAKKLLIEYTQANTMNLYNEIEKLMIYKDHISQDDVRQLVTRPFEESVFALANALIANDKAQALQIYRDFIVLSLEPLAFIINLANQFRVYAEVFILSDKRMSKDEIASELSIHPYRVQLALQMRQKLSLDTVFALIDKLHDLDYKIKSGQVDRFFAFELFIINY